MTNAENLDASRESAAPGHSQHMGHTDDRRDRRERGRGGNTILVIALTIILVCCLLLFACVGGFIFLGSLDTTAVATDPDDAYFYENVTGNAESEHKLLSIVISGPILTNSDTEGGGLNLFGGGGLSYGYDIKEQLYRAAEDDEIDGIILEINSPGGTITGSQAISDGVEHYREETGNPVIAHCSGLCASGSYWAAISTDYIIVDAGSLTGSIGVIYGPFQYYDGLIEEGSFLGSVLTQNGIETKYFTGGQYKDNGSPYRRLTEEEVKIIQADIDNEYQHFVDYVMERRNLSETAVKQEIKALVYGTDKSLELKLADREGNREEAYAELVERAELDGDDYQIVRETTTLGFWEQVFVGADREGPAAPNQQSAGNVPGSGSCALCDVPVYFHGNPRGLGF